MTGRRTLSWWPLGHLVLGFASGLATYLTSTRWAERAMSAFLDGRRQDLYTALTGVQTTLLGFALATLAIVLGFAQTPRFQVLRDSRWYSSLFAVFTGSVRAFAVAAGLAFVALLFDRDGSDVPLLTALVAGICSHRGGARGASHRGAAEGRADSHFRR
jgi:hypothetical protein